MGDERNPLEVAKEAAESKMAEINKAKEGSKVPEIEQAENKQKELQRILHTKDVDLSPEELALKKETLSKDKDTRVQEKIDKRISDLTSQLDTLKADKDSDKERIAALEKELKEAKGSKDEKKDEETFEQKSVKAAQERIGKYLEEDKEKPREQRREMSKEELEDWLDEDQVAAYEWMTKRTIRREREVIKYKYDNDTQNAVKDFYEKQSKSSERVWAKHPDLDVKKRENELREEYGKGKDLKDESVAKEVNKQIFDTICKENEKYKICYEITMENPEKYLLAENGPELIAEEMEKRMKPEKKENKKEGAFVFNTQEELDAYIKEQQEEEEERQRNIDEGITSTRSKPKDKNLTDFERKQVDLAKKAGLTEEQLKKSIERRSKIPGAASY